MLIYEATLNLDMLKFQWGVAIPLALVEAANICS